MNVLSAILLGSAAKCASKMATTPKRAKRIEKMRKKMHQVSLTSGRETLPS